MVFESRNLETMLTELTNRLSQIIIDRWPRLKGSNEDRYFMLLPAYRAITSRPPE